MPIEPDKLWTFIQSGGVSGVLFIGFVLFFWLYMTERNARTQDLKSNAEQFLAFSRTHDKVAAALDSLSQRVEALERRIDWGKRG